MAKRPTILDVARAAGVSKTTVSRVIGGQEALVDPQTRQRVQDAIARLGYVPNSVAKNLRTSRTNMVLLVIPDVANPFWADVAKGAQERFEADGNPVVLANTNWDPRRERQFLTMAHRNRFDGIIINPCAVSSEELTEYGIPTVVLGPPQRYPHHDTVQTDSYSGTRLAVEHLIALGHRHIAILGGVNPNTASPRRLEAYRDTLAQWGIPVEPGYVVDCAYTLAAGRAGMDYLLQLPQPPTAVFSGNDVVAFGALQAAASLGVGVPTDLSIVGMDDVDAAQVTTPPLTTVHKPTYELGREAASLLLTRMHNQVSLPPRSVQLSCHLVCRCSTAPPAFP